MLGRSDSNSNADTDSGRNADTHTNSNAGAYRSSGDVESATRLHLYFFECHFPVERRQRYSLWTSCREFPGQRKYLRFVPIVRPFGYRK